LWRGEISTLFQFLGDSNKMTTNEMINLFGNLKPANEIAVNNNLSVYQVTRSNRYGIADRQNFGKVLAHSKHIIVIKLALRKLLAAQ
jgi:predicted acyltransferase (DUF342 family)